MPIDPEAPAPVAAREGAWAAINEVIDPCSRFNGSHLGLVDLGMVKDVSVEGHSATVTLLLDDPVCIYTFVIQQEIRQALGKRGIHDVDIEICADELWTADRLSDFAGIRLGRRPGPGHRVPGTNGL
jgi:metal-sulfur cluster biosynthetic enzyme